MHFERSLQRATYEPWKDQYIDYSKLKDLLRDNDSDADSDAGSDAGRKGGQDWSEKDEEAFVEELINVQLEKVHDFQSNTAQKLRERNSVCEAQLDPVVVKRNRKDENGANEAKLDDEDEKTLQSVLKELDSITREMNELEKFSRINYTGFLKAAKKHDRRRGHAYRVMPIMRVRLGELPFNKEDYSPLLFRLSTMYSFCRQRLEGGDKPRTQSDVLTHVENYTSHKFWVHEDNLLELKTVILRRLPALIFNPQASKIVDAGQRDPSMTSIYFDNPRFSLYNAKVGQTWPATSLRLRWYDQLSEANEIFVEKKTVYEDDSSKEQRFSAKPKYIQGFLKGEHHMEKEVQRLADRVGEDSEQVQRLRETINDIQTFVREEDLQPMVRANYNRTAFQIPGDNRVRITLDSDLALIREDAIDEERPCRSPDDWHRRDIDDAEEEYPFSNIRKGEINRFPYVLLEIRLKGEKKFEWVKELMDSHLVKGAPRFSKFVHGVAQLFDDYVNTFPFWLNEVDTDIRQDPHQAFEEEQQRNAKIAEDEIAVGSLLTAHSKSFTKGLKPDTKSPVGSPSSKLLSKSSPDRRASAKTTRVQTRDYAKNKGKGTNTEGDEDEDDDADKAPGAATDKRGIASYLQDFSMSKYAKAQRRRFQPGHSAGSKVLAPLPEGVKEPAFWIKDEGEVRIEAKVWLANQRTFIKWQHVAILLASLSLGLFNAAGKNNNVARTLGAVYTVIAVFIAFWGWAVYMWRSNLIHRRSGKDFDNVIGPLIVCVGLVVALCLNFGFKYNAVLMDRDPTRGNATRGATAA